MLLADSMRGKWRRSGSPTQQSRINCFDRYKPTSLLSPLQHEKTPHSTHITRAGKVEVCIISSASLGEDGRIIEYQTPQIRLGTQNTQEQQLQAALDAATKETGESQA
jgi:hypothetical protein